MVVIANCYQLISYHIPVSEKLYNFVTQCHGHLKTIVDGSDEGENNLYDLGELSLCFYICLYLFSMS